MGLYMWGIMGHWDFSIEFPFTTEKFHVGFGIPKA